MTKQPIGVFDSGVGGLFIAKALASAMPRERVVYFGDTENFPYGQKSQDFIVQRSLSIVEYLATLHCKLVVVACNTVSALALGSIKGIAKVPVVDTISPVMSAPKIDSGHTIGVIGTPNTIGSEIWQKSLWGKYKESKIYAHPCPSLASWIEQGELGDEQLCEVVSEQTLGLPRVDTLILGCTHYSLIKKYLHLCYPKTYLLDPAEAVVNKVRDLLIKEKICA